MTYTRLGIGLGIVAGILLVVLAFTTVHALKAPVIGVIALALLVAGGNWMNHIFGIQRKAQEFQRREEEPEDS